MNRVLILGGYGNFGARIAAALVKDGVSIIITGRDLKQAQALRDKLAQQAPDVEITAAAFDADKELDQQLSSLKPVVVINTIGPYQTADYSIPQLCIQHHIHYIDLADARDFVTGITELDAAAKANDVLVVSGASTVPGLSSAVMHHYKNQFAVIDSLVYGITPGQKAPRGLATTQSILTYLGKPLKPCGRQPRQRYGWQDNYRQQYPELGKRWMANCEIPDLDLFVERYQLKTIQFSAGMESSLLHLGMWMMSWLVRMGLPLDLPRHARGLLAFSHMFDNLGTTSGGMHMLIKGKSHAGLPLEIKWFLVAADNDGPQIPCIPAIILSQKLVRGELPTRGAMPCVEMITLEEYMDKLQGFAIRQFV